VVTDRVFDIGPTSPANVTIVGVTVQGGNVAGANGGGILVSTESTLDFRQGAVVNNIAGLRGGGIAFPGTVATTGAGTINVTQAAISGNRAQGEAGGLYNLRTANLTQVTMEGNLAQGERGGAISNSGTLNTVQTTIRNNRGPVGGAISNRGDATVSPPVVGTVNLRQTDILNNVAFGTAGGIANAGNLTMFLVNVTENTSPAVGGLGNQGPLGVATITQSAFRRNTTAGSGGGIGNSGRITMARSTVEGNQAGLTGAGIANQAVTPTTPSRIDIEGGFIQDNIFSINNGNQRGAGFANNGLLNMNGTQVLR
jgi:hypothetical protein